MTALGGSLEAYKSLCSKLGGRRAGPPWWRVQTSAE